ncbi:hypothetical protein AVEN_2915-1 [Araneus ventricosus]|uniref:LRRNT domain-containing protein n=1 Tax=Araneus ventricosus TaxID=182803 RepID=A0A4Y2B5U7_ARAVE|nr:hypothetical protein AVEN_2915-1 [Araneus ventricosus]
MHLKVSIALIAYLVFAYVKAETCPPESLTRPCECLPELDLTLECRNITDASVLGGISRRTGDITFEKLRMFNSRIESMPPNTLTKKQFKAIEIYDSKLNSLFDGIDESNSVRALDLFHVEFGQTFPWSQLKPLKNLRTFVHLVMFCALYHNV